MGTVIWVLLSARFPTDLYLLACYPVKRKYRWLAPILRIWKKLLPACQLLKILVLPLASWPTRKFGKGSGIIYSIPINSISPDNLSMFNVVMLELILDHTRVITKGFEQWTSYIQRRYLTHVVCTKFTVRTVLLST